MTGPESGVKLTQPSLASCAIIRHSEWLAVSKSPRAVTNCSMPSRTGPADRGVDTERLCIAGNTSVIPSSITCFSVNATGGTNCMDPSDRLLAEENWRKTSSHSGSTVLDSDGECEFRYRVEMSKYFKLESNGSNRVLQASTRDGRGPFASSKNFNCNPPGGVHLCRPNVTSMK